MEELLRILKELSKEEEDLKSELEEVVKREEVLIAVYQTLLGADADDIEEELREIRTERGNIVHKLHTLRSRIKTLESLTKTKSES